MNPFFFSAGAVASSGGLQALISNATGLSGFSATNYLSSSDASELVATAAMTLVVHFRVDALVGVERIFSKGSASADDWSVYMIDQELFFRFWGNTVSMDITAVEADAVGNTFVAVGTIDASGANLFLGSLSPNLDNSLRGFSRTPVEDLTVTAFATGSLPAAIGAQRGDNPLQPSPNITIIGCGMGEAKLTAAQAAELMRDASALGYIPNDFPGASHVYNAVTGLHLDQVGDVDLTVNGALTTEADFAPTYPGLVHAGVMMIGQSNAVAPVTVANFTASLLDAYPSVRQYFGSNWVDLDDRGDNATASEIVFMRNLDVPGFIGSADDARLGKRASSGTGFTTGDWNPTDGLYLAALGAWEDSHGDLVDPLDFMELRLVVWIQGEADAQNATDAGAYQAAENAMFTAILSDYLGATPSTVFVNPLLPSFQTGLSDLSTVNAAKTANAAARGDVLLINTDNLTDRGDSLHYDESSHESLGAAIASAYLLNADQIAA